MSRFKKSFGKFAVNRKNQYNCGAGKKGSGGFQPGNTCGGNGDGKDTSADQGGGDKKSDVRSQMDEYEENVISRYEQKIRDKTERQLDWDEATDEENLKELIPLSMALSYFIDNGEEDIAWTGTSNYNDKIDEFVSHVVSNGGDESIAEIVAESFMTDKPTGRGAGSSPYRPTERQQANQEEIDQISRDRKAQGWR